MERSSFAVSFFVVAIACVASGESSARAQASAEPPPVVRAVCPSVSQRAPGAHADAVAIAEALREITDEPAAAAILCRAGITERAFAHGLVHLARLRLRGERAAEGLELLRAVADTYGEPFALAQLATLRIGSPGRSGVDRDARAAYCESRAAISIAGSSAAGGEDSLLRLIRATAGIVLQTLGQGPSARELQSESSAREILECVSRRRARYEARFGALAPDRSLAGDRVRAGLRP